MRCFLHIGTEKTGTSALQTRLSRSRDALTRKGIRFVSGAPFDERCMHAGRISGGNALKMADDIHRADWDRVTQRLARMVSEATAHSCQAVLISSELLLNPLASNGQLEQFIKCANVVNLQTTEFLLILRDPAAQCLSLYKHRAKRGTAGNIAEWAENGYRLPQELQGFRLQAERLGITPTVRGYTQAPGGLDQRFFEDWLGVPTPDVEMPQRVNPSLTLSELVLIHQMAGRRPALVTPLYEALLAIDPSEKVQGEAMAAHARAVATAAVAAHAEEWAAWNRYLPPDEALTIPEAPAEIPPRPRELGLTDQQMAALAAVIDEAATSRFLARMVWQSRIRPVLSRLKHGSRRSKS